MKMRLLAGTYLADMLVQAYLALKDNRLRTTLSILGITIGISAVMAVGAVSKGGKYLVFSELETFGLKTVWVYRDLKQKDPRKAVRSGSGIERADYEAVKDADCSAINISTPVFMTAFREKMLIRNGTRYSNAQLEGVGADYQVINNDTVVSGRFFSEDDVSRVRPVAVIASEPSADLFGRDSNPVGRDIRVGNKRVTIIGILEDKSRSFLSSISSSGGHNANNRLLMPYTVLQQMYGTKEISLIQAEAIDIGLADKAVSQMRSILEHRNGKIFDYRTDTLARFIETSGKIMSGVTLIGIIAASVSLLVGGMGIMNIMSTSVLERTREIGIRKALGARRSEILMQFILEAMLIGFTGGFLGLISGAAASYGLAKITGFPLEPSWEIILLALLVSIGIGLVSGFYPAYRASNLKPVEALRFE